MFGKAKKVCRLGKTQKLKSMVFFNFIELSSSKETCGIEEKKLIKVFWNTTDLCEHLLLDFFSIFRVLCSLFAKITFHLVTIICDKCLGVQKLLQQSFLFFWPWMTVLLGCFLVKKKFLRNIFFQMLSKNKCYLLDTFQSHLETTYF